jgi:hypothetical protein
VNQTVCNGCVIPSVRVAAQREEGQRSAHGNRKFAGWSGRITGAQLYKQNCAVCHGNDGKGNGAPPSSSPFTESPPDLTTLAQRHKGEFPEAYVADVLRNGVKMPDHGPAEMPVWGIIFKSMAKSDETQVKVRITNLTNYLKSIQTK